MLLGPSAGGLEWRMITRVTLTTVSQGSFSNAPSHVVGHEGSVNVQRSSQVVVEDRVASRFVWSENRGHHDPNLSNLVSFQQRSPLLFPLPRCQRTSCTWHVSLARSEDGNGLEFSSPSLSCSTSLSASLFHQGSLSARSQPPLRHTVQQDLILQILYT